MTGHVERAAVILHDQLVATRGDALMELLDNPDYAAGEGERFQAAAARIRGMAPDDRQAVAAVIRRAAADTLLDVLGLINGSYGLNGFDGEWALTLDGQDVGGAVLETVLERESEIA